MTDSKPIPRRMLFWQMPLVTFLLAGHFILAVAAAPRHCPTYDEIAHLTAGYSFWRCNDYRLPGNWPQRWAALPLLWTEPAFPDDESDWFSANLWQTGKHFFYDSGNDAETMLVRGRIMIALLGVVLGGLVFGWAWRLFGAAAGFLALGLYLICPALLASGALATAELPAAWFFLASLAASWRLLHEATWGSLLVCGLAVAGLFLTTYAAVVLLPVAGLLLLLRIADGRPLSVRLGGAWILTGRLRLIGALAVMFLAIGAIVWALIWVSYGCRHDALNKPAAGWDRLRPGWEAVCDDPHFRQSSAAQTILRLRDTRLLPEGYLYWFAYALRTSIQRQEFLNGVNNASGPDWVARYTFLVRTPPGILAIMLIAGLSVRALWNRRGWRETWQGFYAAAPLWIFLAVFATAAAVGQTTIPQGGILPVYPAMFVLAGAAARFWSGAAADVGSEPAYPIQARILCGLLLLTSLGWAAVETLRAWPNYLDYFNLIAGGPNRLVNGSLDWGQDLPDLKKWIDEHDPERREQICLCLYSADPFKPTPPELPILHAQPVPLGFEGGALPATIPDSLQPGIYFVSAAYLQVPDRWTVAQEKQYQKNMTFRWHYGHSDDAASQYLLQCFEESDARAERMEDTWRGSFQASYHPLRFARLLRYLRERRKPDGEVNHSILFFRLTDDDLNEAFLPLVLEE